MLILMQYVLSRSVVMGWLYYIQAIHGTSFNFKLIEVNVTWKSESLWVFLNSLNIQLCRLGNNRHSSCKRQYRKSNTLLLICYRFYLFYQKKSNLYIRFFITIFVFRCLYFNVETNKIIIESILCIYKYEIIADTRLMVPIGN